MSTTATTAFVDPLTTRGELRLWWRFAMGMYALGGLTLLMILPLPDPDPSDHGRLLVIGLLQAVVAVGLALAGPRSRALLRASAVAGIVMVSLTALVAKPLGATPLFYLWPMLIAAYFLGRHELLVCIAVFVSSYAAAMLFSEGEATDMIFFSGGVASVTLVAFVVNALKANVDALVLQLRESAATDPLTGLANRRSFEDSLQRALIRARRSVVPLTVVVLDLDHFKRVNDRLGHDAGDRALRDVAEALRAEARGGDLIARLGGEEFVALLPDTDIVGGCAFAERVAASRHLAQAPGGPLSLSAGVAGHGPSRATRDELMLAADRALYAAKRAGRGRVATSEADVRALPTA